MLSNSEYLGINRQKTFPLKFYSLNQSPNLIPNSWLITDKNIQPYFWEYPPSPPNQRTFMLWLFKYRTYSCSIKETC